MTLDITSRGDDEEVDAPSLELVWDVIRNMTSLTYLKIKDDGFDRDEMAILKREVDDRAKVSRHNFVFVVQPLD